ncbi:MAG: response regulator [Chloroflexota bacterium]|nr:MAG: response regulator [Chloroflexota bacterium]
MGERKLLIVDDDPDILVAIGAVLESHGYQLIKARNGEEALDKLAQEKPDLMILDLLMPRMDGFAVCRELKEPRRGKQYPKLPILILTSTREEAGRRRYELETGLDLDVDDYVEKPVDPHLLVQRVERLLEKWAKADYVLWHTRQ